MHIEIHFYLPLPVSCLLGSVIDRAFGCTKIASGRFSVSQQVGTSDLQQILYRFKLGTRVESDPTQQMSPGIPRLAGTGQVFTDVTESQGVVMVRTTEFIRPKQTNIWPCEIRAMH